MSLADLVASVLDGDERDRCICGSPVTGDEVLCRSCRQQCAESLGDLDI